MANAFKDVITRLEKQRSSIERALAALREVDDTAEVTSPKSFRSMAKGKSKSTRKISDEARARMVEGQKKRWAAKRVAEKRSAKKRVPAQRSVTKAKEE